MNSPELKKAFDQLKNYIEKEEFKGYDPYDTLTSPIKFKAFGKWPPIIATQVQKRNLINIRPLLGIKKQYNPKALGLLLYSYCLLQENEPDKDYSQQIKFLFNYLKENSSQGFSGYCWGYNFDWAGAKKYLNAFSPNIVVTAFVAKGIFKYYQFSKDAEALKILESIPDFILNDLARTETQDGICFSYTTIAVECCYNASLHAATVLSQVYSINKKEEYKTLALKAVDFVVSKQFPDGHWNYSIDPKTGIEREQIDFHQGYNIDCITEIMKNCDVNNSDYKKAIEKGSEFFMKQQFFESGQSKWRLPKIYPVEIHNQSQGIITFNRMGKLNEDYSKFSLKIAQWTIKHMQDRTGYFYYRKLKFFTNKISYMRWSQAWMFLALTELIYLKENEKY